MVLIHITNRIILPYFHFISVYKLLSRNKPYVIMLINLQQKNLIHPSLSHFRNVFDTVCISYR